MLFNKIKDLCKKNRTTITELERSLKFGNGTIHKWNVAQPSVDKVLKVAEYFDVSLDYLLGIDEILPSQEAKELSKAYDSFTDDQKNLIKCYVSIIRKEQTA